MAKDFLNIQNNLDITVCPGSSDPFHTLSYYIKWVTTSWTHSKTIFKMHEHLSENYLLGILLPLRTYVIF